MGSNWKNIPLGNLITLQRGHDLPSQDRTEGSVPIMGSSGLTGWHNQVKMSGPGVVVGRSGNSMGVVSYSESDFWPLNTCLYVTDFKGNDVRYIYYLLQQVNFDQFNSGSAQKSLNRNAVYPFEVYATEEKEEQRAIAKLLSEFEKKITLNNQINQTLEQMAQTLFKSWFVDFDPVRQNMCNKEQVKMNGEQPKGMNAPFLSKEVASLFPEKLVESELGLIPDGWKVGTLSDVAEYCSARTTIDTVTLENYISTENMLADKKGVTAASKLPIAKTISAYKTGDILVSNIRPYFKKIWLAEGDGGRSNDVLGFESCTPNTDSYLMNFLYQDMFFEYMMRTSKGAKMPRGDKTAIMNWDMAVPPVELRQAFSAIVDPFYDLIPQNHAKNKTLKSLRDTLLPKLLSGEVEL
ncbi:restriction endonuclease subunit S [Shewanella sp. YLB-07]|uniref:restriction endonuclease subunit S n=1 Tax=Shewanella sp. YLB-07 TaxID=2601268 RepID=UPI00128B8D40|nr:restriction endonuclease subunit S [Shewanella sp. YLB-07]MPY24521.1 restriction endonuclease subunit S [Shewanella sp. YLB-07]